MNSHGAGGRVALVVGGSGGIGAAVTAALTSAGQRVAIAYSTDQEAAARTVAETGCLSIHSDVTDPGQVETLFAGVHAALGADVQILVNCAGLLCDALIAEMTPEQWQAALAVNLTAPFLCASRAAAGMSAAGWGRIVNIGSPAGVLGSAGQANYAAAKAGLIGLTRSLARELAPTTTANLVLPGPVDTALITHLTDKRRRQICSLVPMKRFGTPAEAAAPVLFLCSEAASYVTGAVLSVDGGMSMGH